LLGFNESTYPSITGTESYVQDIVPLMLGCTSYLKYNSISETTCKNKKMEFPNIE
jgi:hypothetical protein